VDVVESKLIKRGVPVRNLDYGAVDSASGGKARQLVKLQQGITTEKGKEIVKAIKAGGPTLVDVFEQHPGLIQPEDVDQN
jgi:cyclic-di-GMP-binding protein